MTKQKHRRELVEDVSFQSKRLRVELPSDPQEGIGRVRGVKILGWTSKNNNRRYLKEGVNPALYNNVPVNINHPTDEEKKLPRNYQARFGWIENPVARDDGIYGDLCFNPLHAITKDFVWWANNKPDKIGLSQNAYGDVWEGANDEVVESVDEVRSVDLVSDPATTAGLFEARMSLTEERYETGDAIDPFTDGYEHGAAGENPRPTSNHPDYMKGYRKGMTDSGFNSPPKLPRGPKKDIKTGGGHGYSEDVEEAVINRRGAPTGPATNPPDDDGDIYYSPPKHPQAKSQYDRGFRHGMYGDEPKDKSEHYLAGHAHGSEHWQDYLASKKERTQEGCGTSMREGEDEDMLDEIENADPEKQTKLHKSVAKEIKQTDPGKKTVKESDGDLDNVIHSTRIIKTPDEYVVKAYNHKGKELPNSHYYTGGLENSHRKDAKDTATAMTRESKSKKSTQEGEGDSLQEAGSSHFRIGYHHGYMAGDEGGGVDRKQVRVPKEIVALDAAHAQKQKKAGYPNTASYQPSPSTAYINGYLGGSADRSNGEPHRYKKATQEGLPEDGNEETNLTADEVRQLNMARTQKGKDMKNKTMKEATPPSSAGTKDPMDDGTTDFSEEPVENGGSGPLNRADLVEDDEEEMPGTPPPDIDDSTPPPMDGEDIDPENDGEEIGGLDLSAETMSALEKVLGAKLPVKETIKRVVAILKAHLMEMTEGLAPKDLPQAKRLLREGFLGLLNNHATRLVLGELDTYEVARKLNAKKVKARKLISVAKLPEEAVTTHFMEGLVRCKTEREMQDMIDDRRQVLRLASKASRRPRSAAGDDILLEGEIDPPTKDKTKKNLTEADKQKQEDAAFAEFEAEALGVN